MEFVSRDQQNPNQTEASDIERWASLVSGGTMVLMGLKQRSLRGVLMALAGGGLIYQGAKKQSTINQVQQIMGVNQSIKVEKTLTINKPVNELYHFWRKFENLPKFMKHLNSVTVQNEKRSHWVATAPLGASIEWDADIIEERENEFISWTSVEGSDVDNSGFIRFKKVPDRGTEVKVVIEYNPPGGALAAAFAKLFGEEPEQQLGDDLRRFKMLMETGEIATTEGQARGNS